jgi:ABC-type antimicrobial peptide transport system permease subunit
LALALSRSLEGLLFGVSSVDLRTYVGTALALLFVASLAAFLASRAAATVNPLTALRDE